MKINNVIIMSVFLFCSILESESSDLDMKEETIGYYNKNSAIFYERTINVDFSPYYSKFLPLIPDRGSILDVGCGVGRDAHYFEKLDYEVLAIDGSEEMVRLSNEILNRPAELVLFQDIRYREEFDGVWAAASLIHVPDHELQDILGKLHTSLKQDGVLLATFKHGSGHYTQEGRTFYYMTEEVLRPKLEGMFEVLDVWKTEDLSSSVAHSPDRTWLNIIMKKV